LAPPVSGALPRVAPVVTMEALVAAGVRMQDESRLRSFGAAAAIVLKTAQEVAYDSLRLEYMQSFASKF